jgi:hypothetical protein
MSSGNVHSSQKVSVKPNLDDVVAEHDKPHLGLGLGSKVGRYCITIPLVAMTLCMWIVVELHGELSPVVAGWPSPVPTPLILGTYLYFELLMLHEELHPSSYI